MTRSRATSIPAQIRAQKEELRRRIERSPRLKKDFDFLVVKSHLTPRQLITGLWLDCNMMKAGWQALISSEKSEIWPISRDDLRRLIKNTKSVARRIEAVSKTDFSPLPTITLGDKVVGLPEVLRAYATELQRKLDIWDPYWQRKRARIPCFVALTRQNSVYERIRSSAGSYHQTRLLRLLNVAREVKDYRKIGQRAFITWLKIHYFHRPAEESLRVGYGKGVRCPH
jgi:hypothetical protein